MEQICGNCKHYVRHFVCFNGRFSPIEQGHCTYPRNKYRTAKHNACEYFEGKEHDDKIEVIEIKIKHKII